MKSQRPVDDAAAARAPVSAQAADPKRVCVARIGAAHGVRGDVKLWSFTADPMAVASYGRLETADGAHSLEIETARPGKDCLVVRFKGVRDRTAAERLRNVELFVPRERLPETEDENEFYHADLIGLAVVDTRDAVLGAVVAVHNFGAGDILEVRRADGRGTVMLPFTTQAVPVVDVAGGRLVVVPTEDLVEPPGAARGRA
jgi:16S rRNA processing protein RimM